MTVSLVSEGESGARAGSQTLAMLASSVKSEILGALTGGPKGLAELGRDLGAPIRVPGVDPDGHEVRITPSGREMLFVSATLEHWLSRAPGGVLPYGGDGATEAIEGLAGSWASTVLHALASRPHSLAELDRAVDAVGCVFLERCLETMRRAGQIEAHAGDGEGAAYSVTDWLRRGVGPLAAAARLERRHFAENTPPIAALDVEAAFLLAVPLLRLPATLSGSCRLAVELVDDRGLREAGAMVRLEEGRVASCSTRLTHEAGASARGDLRTWFGAVIEADLDGMELDGDRAVATGIVEGLHAVLYGSFD